MSKKEYKGKNLTIFFDGEKCIHSRFCVLGQPKVFQANVKGDWIKPDNGSAENLAALAHTCPSGAITYERHDGGENETPPDVNTIRVLENGPYAVHAEINIENQGPETRSTLCRCGASKNKPYCDGSHHDINFEATGEPLTKESEPLGKRDGVLNFSPAKDGPLMMSGNVEIIAGTGRTINRTQKAALCRCGASNNKPYCDGSHVGVGFKTDE